MSKEFNPIKYAKMAKSMKKVISVFYIVSIVSLAAFVIAAVLCMALPEDYFNIRHFQNGSFSFALNGLIKYDISVSQLPADTSFRKIFTSIVGSAFLYSLAMMRIFKYLRDLLKTVADGVPFDKENPSRLVNIGAVIIGVAFLFPALNELVAGRMIDAFLLEGFSLNYSVDWFLLMTGWMVLILAGVFRYGCYLQNEYDETL